MVDVVPAIIPKSFEDLQEKALKVAPFVKNVQIDIMDGVFAPEPSYPFIDGDTSKLQENFAKEARLGLELDMMVMHPEKYIDLWSTFGIGTFIVHIGTTDEIESLIKELRTQGKGVAIAFKPSTPKEEIETYIEDVDFVQCMGNDKIGFHGVALDPEALNMIRDLRSSYPNSIISVDIGVNFETAPKLVDAGVSKLVSGSAIYHSSDIQEAIRTLSIS